MPSAAGAGGLTIRPLESGDGLDDLFDLRCRAFGPMGPQQRARWQAQVEPAVGAGRYLAGFAGSRLVAAGRIHDMTQWWYGRAVPMAGVASVAVAPEERGRGAGRALMTGLLEQIASRGYPLSVLFPMTRPLYRSLGWEIAGSSDEAVIPARALRSLATSPAAGEGAGVRRAGPDDAAEANELLGRVHAAARDCGPNLREEASVRLLLDDEDFYCYLADDGLLAYSWHSGNDEIFVPLAVAASARTTRALWGIVASHCWVAGTVRAWTGPADPLWWLVRESFDANVERDDWMLRVVDPAAAIAARGFPAAVDLAALLEISDAARPGNSGVWRLEVSGGRGSLLRAGGPGGPALSLGAGGLAALYAGTPVATLRRAGLAGDGDAASDALLDAAFAARPFMCDRF